MAVRSKHHDTCGRLWAEHSISTDGRASWVCPEPESPQGRVQSSYDADDRQ